MVKPKDKQLGVVPPAELTVSAKSLFVPPEDKIGERIKEAREKIGLNFEQLARLTVEYDAPQYEQGISAAMLARYERGVDDGRPVLPGARELRLLCEALDVRADWLLLGMKEDTETAEALLKSFQETLMGISAWREHPSRDNSFKLIQRAEYLRRARVSPGKTKL